MGIILLGRRKYLLGRQIKIRDQSVQNFYVLRPIKAFCMKSFNRTQKIK